MIFSLNFLSKESSKNRVSGIDVGSPSLSGPLEDERRFSGSIEMKHHRRWMLSKKSSISSPFSKRIVRDLSCGDLLILRRSVEGVVTLAER